MYKSFLVIAGCLGALAVALGAFGAHALKTRLSEEALNVYETAVKYQFYHVFALLMVAILYQFYNNNIMLLSGRLFIAGILLFSGSLYLLTYFKSTGNENMNWLGAITPLGGACLIAGWVCMAFSIYKNI